MKYLKKYFLPVFCILSLRASCPQSLQHQRRRRICAACQLAVQHIQAAGVVAEQLHLRNQIRGVFLLLALLLDKPVKELGCPEIIYLLSRGVNRVDQRSHKIGRASWRERVLRLV